MKISEDVLKVLEKSTVKADKNGTALYLPAEKLDRQLYEAVNKILQCLGGKWNRKAGAHLFVEDVAESIDAAMLTGQITDAKKEFQFFETPRKVALMMLDLAEPMNQNMRILEPSAGAGAIARQIQIAGYQPDCVELWDKNRKILKNLDLALVGDDFLKLNPGPVYDRILANPPFTKQQDVDHVLHMWDCLKPGGRIVTVMSPSWTFRDNKKSTEFRGFLNEVHAERTELPAGTFSESGTEIRSMLVVINK
jgi:type I restriction-modification system DNA methylase subunit